MFRFLYWIRQGLWLPQSVRNLWVWRRFFYSDTTSSKLLILFLIFAFSLPFYSSDYRLFQLSNTCAYAIGIIGLNLLTGHNGQLSIGHGAFFGIGAFAQAILVSKFGFSFEQAFLISGAISFGCGIIFGFPALRLEGTSLALATFSLGLAIPQIFERFDNLTGGSTGTRLSFPDLPAQIKLWGLSKEGYVYLLGLILLFVCLFLTQNLIANKTGRAIRAIRDNDISSEAFGINNNFFMVLCFGLSSLITGLGGAFFAISNQHVAPENFTFLLSISFLSGMILGGLGSLFGPIFGALFIQYVPHFMERFSKDLILAMYGLVLIMFIFVDSRGLVGIFKKMRAILVRISALFRI